MIPKGFGKYLIIKVLKATWQKYDEDMHYPGSYIMWNNGNTLPSQIIDFYTDDGEGIMSVTADTIEVLQLKQDLKRKSQPESESMCSRVKERKWVSHVNVN